jgi:CRISPR-associated protein Csm5
MAEYIKCYLQTLAPIHLGCDEVYEPMGFVLDEKNHRLIVYDPWSFFQQMSDLDKKKFTDICRQGSINSILQIYKFLQGRQAAGRAVAVCPGFISHYQKTLALPLSNTKKIQQELNNFTIARTAFLPDDGRPYIPGSAVKGVLRTAYLNQQSRKTQVGTPRGRGAGRELEKKLLDGGTFATDPFRLLKVSDFMPVGEVKTRVIYAINEKKKASKFQARGPYQILEVILPGAAFVGSLLLDSPLEGAGIKKPISRSELLEAAASFYNTEKKREEEDLFELGLQKITVSPPAPDFLLRLGRHSGAECLTIAGHRQIRIMQGQGQPSKTLDHATTFWLAAEADKPQNKSHLQPFGWAAARELTPEIEADFKKSEDEWRQQSSFLAPVEAEPAAPSAAKAPPAPVVQVHETWEKASLTWNPGSGELTATTGPKKAFVKGGKGLVPEALHKNLFVKKKAVSAEVTVEPLGNAYKIIAVTVKG